MDPNSVALQKIIASYCPVSYQNVDLSVVLQDHYVPTPERDSFSSDICAKWPNIDCTVLHNQMFNPLQTGNNILTFIAAS